MLVIAVICGLAGTWQAERFQEKRKANQRLALAQPRLPLDLRLDLDGDDIPEGFKRRS